MSTPAEREAPTKAAEPSGADIAKTRQNFTAPGSVNPALRPFVLALADLLVADLLRHPPGTV